MAIPDKANATLTVRTYNGGFRSTFPIDDSTSRSRNKRFTVTLGNGSAHVELESFGGTIALRRPGEPRPETERKRRERDKDKDNDKDNLGAFRSAHGSIDGEVDAGAMAGARQRAGDRPRRRRRDAARSIRRSTGDGATCSRRSMPAVSEAMAEIE